MIMLIITDILECLLRIHAITYTFQCNGQTIDLMFLMIQIGIKDCHRVRISAGFLFQGIPKHYIIKFFQVMGFQMFVFLAIICPAE